MTTVPGHNLILQQSGLAQEVSQQAHAPKPGPEQAAALQQAQEIARNSSVQQSDGTDGIRDKKQKLKRRKLAKQGLQATKKKSEQAALDPDAPGQLLDTTV